MARRCLIDACKREAEIYCYHCSQDVCSKHFFEHKKWIQDQLPLLTDEVNLIYERLRRNDDDPTSVPPYLINIYDELDIWREDSHHCIDMAYRRVRSQIADIIEKHKHDENQQVVKKLEALEKMRQQLNELLKEGDVTYRQLETMKHQLEEIETKELRPVQYPSVRIITQKLDVDKYVSVIIDTKYPNAQQQPRHKKKSARLGLFDQPSSVSTIPSEEKVEKCPICFMIFPSSMSAENRTQHVDMHYSEKI